MPHPSKSRGHNRDNRWSELDGMRCFAVTGVLAVHFDPGKYGNLPLGDWGVRFFFVLSGFLITHGLIKARGRIESGSSRPWRELAAFFLRRALRLWPLYFGVIAITTLYDAPFSRLLLPWNLTFTTNHYIHQNDTWPGIQSHLWTLSVEQQFYLLWPFILLFIPYRKIVWFILTCVIIAPVARAWEHSILPADFSARGVLLPMCIDYLAWGELLAWAVMQGFNLTLLRKASAMGGILLLSVLWWWHQSTTPTPLRSAIEGTGVGISALLLIAHCTAPGDSYFRKFLRFPPFVYIGVISYGIYLLHNYSHWFGPSLLRRLTGHNYFENNWAHVAWLTSVSLAAAGLSWHIFERPLAHIGRRVLLPFTDRSS